MPADGQSLVDQGGKADAGPFTAPIPAASFAVNEADRAWVDSKMTPQSTACFTEKIKLTGAYQRIPRKAYHRREEIQGIRNDIRKDCGAIRFVENLGRGLRARRLP